MSVGLFARPATRHGAVALIDCFLHSERDLIDDENYLSLLERLRAYLSATA
jgi:hypothetical protein